VSGAALLVLVLLRAPILRAVGHALVISEPVGHADVIVLTVDSGTAGVLEAADLVRAGVSQRVAFIAAPIDEADIEVRRRGVQIEDNVDRSIRLLHALGVDAGERIPAPVTGTEDEAKVLPAWLETTGVHSAVIVGSADHTRRLRRVFRRSMKSHGATITIRASRSSMFEPDTWWTNRSTLRIGIVELQKLLLDVVLHPLD
jgi:uncharacterized SAM-binding protein YcdF (DUF218 family)